MTKPPFVFSVINLLDITPINTQQFIQVSEIRGVRELITLYVAFSVKIFYVMGRRSNTVSCVHKSVTPSSLSGLLLALFEM